MFETLNFSKHNVSIDLQVNNLEVSPQHWANEKRLWAYAEELELICYKSKIPEEFNKLLIAYLAKLSKQNPRIDKMYIYTDKTDNSIVCVCISDISTFKPENFGKREIKIFVKKMKCHLKINDITKSEWASQENKLPMHWSCQEEFSKKLQKHLMFNF